MPDDHIARTQAVTADLGLGDIHIVRSRLVMTRAQETNSIAHDLEDAAAHFNAFFLGFGLLNAQDQVLFFEVVNVRHTEIPGYLTQGSQGDIFQFKNFHFELSQLSFSVSRGWDSARATRLNYGYQRLKVDEVQEVVCRSVETLIRKKVLYRFRLLGVYFLVAIDGTGVLTFRKRHCPHCLTKTLHNGETIYYHPVLEAKLVTSNGFAFSLMTEFIENQDLSADKQDCELKAFYRLTERLKARFPRLPICLLLDGLYAGGPTFQIGTDYDWKYLIVLREEDLPNLHRSFTAVIPQLPDQRKHVCLQEVNTGQRTEWVEQEYRWAEDLSYPDSQHRVHHLALIECQETRTDTHGQITNHPLQMDHQLQPDFSQCRPPGQSRRSLALEDRERRLQCPEEQRPEPGAPLQPRPHRSQSLLPAPATGLHDLPTDAARQFAPASFPRWPAHRQEPGISLVGSLAQPTQL